MPYAFVIDPARRMSYARIWGVAFGADFFGLRRDVAAHPDSDPAFDNILDVRDADITALTTAEVQALASTTTLKPTARRAFVTGTGEQFGMARMYQTLRNLTDGHEEMEIFRTPEEALTWLGISDFVPRLATAKIEA